jgi:hypothetical protein
MANPPTIDAKLKEAIPLYEKLKNEWSRKPPNVGKTDELLGALKVIFFLSTFDFNKSISFFRIYLPKVDSIHPIPMKIHVVYILHVSLIPYMNHHIL